MWKAKVLPLQKYPGSSGFSRPDVTGEKLSRSVRPGESTARRVLQKSRDI